jgi:hypothetical protein
MKKNRFLKIASALIILCLITTCAVGTTFAKYTTAGSATDKARVAKGGVELTMDGDPAFATEYKNTTSSVTVRSDNDEKVVAPGTSSSDVAGGLKFAITGKPEVAVDITIDFNWTQDVYLRAMNGLRDWTQAGTEVGGSTTYETFNLAADYYPVVFTLKQTKAAGATVDVELVTGNLAKIKEFLDAYSDGADSIYAPNTDLGAEFELTWAWVINNNDKADTYLGNLMAGLDPNSLTEATGNTAMNDYCVKIAYELTITVEQID